MCLNPVQVPAPPPLEHSQPSGMAWQVAPGKRQSLPHPREAGYLLRARLCPGCPHFPVNGEERYGVLWCGVVCWLAFFFPPQSWHQNHFPECHHTTGRVCDHSGPLGVQLCPPPPRSSAPMLIPPYPKETKGPHILGAGLSASRNPKLFLRKPELGKGQRKKKGSLSPGVVMSPTEIQRSQPVPTSHTWECPITTPPPHTSRN